MPRAISSPTRPPSAAKKPLNHSVDDPKPVAESEIVDTLRRLILHLAAQPNAGPVLAGGPNGRRVILDVEVDGIRCLLVELPLRDPHREMVILSPREREVARMVSKGYANKTIASVLDISSWTVGTYLRRIFAKLGVGARAAMVSRLQEVDSYPANGKPASDTLDLQGPSATRPGR